MIWGGLKEMELSSELDALRELGVILITFFKSILSGREKD